MEDKIQSIHICFWFLEMDYNPVVKIEELSSSIKSIINQDLMYNNEGIHNLISMPRIQGMSKDNMYFFTMSLINANLSINVKEEMDNDEAILLVNNLIQLLYDLLKRIYDVEIIYTSIKLELISLDMKKKSEFSQILHLNEDDYHDFSLRKGFNKDDYYINYIINLNREYNYNISKPANNIQRDLFDRTMLISLQEATLSKEYLLYIIEINDRYAYNNDSKYRTSKENIRGMILELKDILENHKYKRI